MQYFTIFLFVILTACDYKHEPQPEEIKKSTTTYTSTDTKELEQLLSYDTFEPTRIKYHLIISHHHISKGADTIKVPAAT